MNDTDAIPPALTRDEFYTSTVPAPDSVAIRHFRAQQTASGLSIDGRSHVDAEELPALIALANAALPDDSPYKITRADVEHLRYMGQREISADEVGEMGAHAEYGHDLITLAAKLAALLPPV